MAQVYKMEVAIDVATKGLAKKAKEISTKIKGIGKNAKVNIDAATSEKEMKKLDKAIRDTTAEVDRLDRAQDRLKKKNVNSGEYKQLQKDAAAAEKELQRLKDAKDIYAQSGLTGRTVELTNEDYEKQAAKVAGLHEQMAGYETGNTWANPADQAAWQQNAAAIDTAKMKLNEYNAAKDRAAAGSGGFGKVKAALAGIGAKAKAGAKGLLGMVGGKIKSGLASIGKNILGIGRNASRTGGLLNKMKRGLMMGTGIRGLLRLGSAGAAALFMIRGMKQGFENMAQVDGKVNGSISSIQSALLMLKNALAAAFAPILNVIGPIISRFITMLADGANAIAHFFAALTGQKSVTVAKKATVNYAAGLDKAGKNAEKAEKKQKKLNRTLMGFDQINKLEKQDASKSGSNSGAGSGGYTGPSPSQMFEKVNVSKSANDLAKKIKEAWEKADFTELGKTVGQKLTKALEGIDWNKIKKTTEKIAKSIVTFLNGFMEGTDWKLVGGTLAEGVNTIVKFFETAFKHFKWKKLGKSFAETLIGFFSKLDYASMGRTLSHGLKGVLDTIIGFFERIDWQKAGKGLIKALGQLFGSIDWAGIIRKSFRALGNLAGAFAGLVVGIAKGLGKAVSKGVKNAQKYFGKKIKESGGNIPLGILKGIIDGIKGIANWIKKNIFDPFITGFKKAFGIHSPAKEMEDPGKQIILGLLKGIGDNIGSILDWFKELPGKIAETVAKAGGVVLDVVGKLVGDTWKFLTKTIENTAEYVASKVGDVWKTLTSTVSGVAQYTASKIGSVWSALTTTLSGISEYVASKTGDIWDKLSTTVSGVAQYTAEKIGDAWNWIKSKVSGAVQYTAERIGKGWKKVKKKISGVVKYAAERIGKGWKKIKKKVSGVVKYAATKAGKGWRTLTKTLTATVRFAAEWAKGALQNLQKAATKAGSDKFFTYGFKGKSPGKRNANGGIYSQGHWKPVTQAATGGSFNQGQMFVAREAGPELVGTIGGNTAVMNNDQIVSSVASGVAKAVASVMGSSKQGVSVYLQGDAGKLFRVVRQEAKDFTMATGKSAFPV